MRVGFIGAGNMGGALASALASEYKNVIVCDLNEKKLEVFKVRNGLQTTTDSRFLCQVSDVIVFAVKPQGIGKLLVELKDYLKGKLIVSIAAGIKISFIEKKLGAGKRIVRCMPNLGSFVGHGGTGYVINSNCTDDDSKSVKKIFGAGGVVVKVDDEKIIDLISIIGCKPGWLAKELEAEEGILADEGLNPDQYRKLMANVLRAVAEFIDSGEKWNDLYKKVASPGGLTEAGHEYAEKEGLYEHIRNRVKKALERNKEFGE